MNCEDIIREYLKNNGYDGLSGEEGCCCTINDNDFMHCGENCMECEPVHKVFCKDLPKKKLEKVSTRCEGRPCDKCESPYLFWRNMPLVKVEGV